MVDEVNCGDKILDLTQPCIMGILNVTPDSFSDGGRFFDPASAIAKARQMVQEGASIIDVGGESTRPGAQAVEVSEEIRRVIPIVKALHGELDVVISIDTCKPEVMTQSVEAGAGMINDVNALRADGAISTAADLQVPVCLMHMQGDPRSMQHEPKYNNVVAEIQKFLHVRIQNCVDAGISRSQLIVDPGFGFGKTLSHNLQLMRQLSEFKTLQVPLLVGLSRKSMIGMILERPVDQREYGSIALASLAIWQGASILRVHDVRGTMDAMKVCRAVLETL